MFNSHRTAQGVGRFYTRRYLCTRTILTCIISYVYTCTIAFTCKWTFINPRTFILVHNSFSTCHPGRHANAEQLGRHRCLCRTILWNHLSEKTCPMLNCRKIYATPTRLPHQSDNQRSKLQRSNDRRTKQRWMPACNAWRKPWQILSTTLPQ